MASLYQSYLSRMLPQKNFSVAKPPVSREDPKLIAARRKAALEAERKKKISQEFLAKQQAMGAGKWAGKGNDPIENFARGVQQAAVKLPVSMGQSVIKSGSELIKRPVDTTITPKSKMAKAILGEEIIKPMDVQIKESQKKAIDVAETIQPGLKGRKDFSASAGRAPVALAGALMFGGLKAADVDPTIGGGAKKVAGKVAKEVAEQVAKRGAKEVVEQVAKDVTPEIASTMERFIDYTRLKGAKNLQLEEDAARLAEDLGLKMGKTKNSIANQFDEILSRTAQEKGKIEYPVTPKGQQEMAEKAAKEAEMITRPPVKQEKEVLEDLNKIFTPPKEPKKGVIQTGKDLMTKAQTGFTSRFTSLRKTEEQIYKNKGLKPPTRLDMARRFELVAGASGKGQADVQRFSNEVIKQIPKGSEGDFTKVAFLERTKQRLLDNPEVKQVGDWTLDKVEIGLNALKKQLGDDKYNQISKVASGVFQKHLDEALRLQVSSGRMSEEVYNAIKQSNDFYAPFKVMKYIDQAPGGVGASVQTTADLTKAITGIKDTEFGLQDILQTSAEQIYRSRILAEKNLAIQDFAALAYSDETGDIVRAVRPEKRKYLGDGESVVIHGEKARPGYEIIEYFRGGEKQAIEVKKEVAEAITGLNKVQADIVTRTVLGTVATPFRVGATSLNAGFQLVNLLAADMPRAAIMSRYGIQNPVDAVRFTGDFIHSLYSSFRGNLAFKTSKLNPLYQQFLESGAARSTIARELRPEAFKGALGIKTPWTVLNTPKKLVTGTLDTLAKISNAVEETSKLLGIKRGIRLEGLDKLPKAQAARKIQEIAAEVRNYSGSPDFSRSGVYTQPLNLLYMFLNARIQGTTADLARLAGKTGKKEAAAAWARLGTFVGLPAATLFAYNHSSPELEAEYNKLTERDKDSYFHIPKHKYITDNDGNKVMDYWRIPKRESMKMIGNMIEGSLKFAKDRDVEGFKNMSLGILGDLSPVNFQGDNMTERIQSFGSGLNPALKVPIEYGTGKNLFYHSDTVSSPAMAKAKPEDQYRPTTPEIYKTIGKYTKQSPLKIEQAVKSFTGGGLSQFTPPKGVEDRSNIENSPILSPLLRRFQRSLTSTSGDFSEKMDAVKQEQASKQLNTRRDAEALYAELKQLPPKEANIKLSEIKKENPKLAEKVKEIKKEDDLGITYKDRAIKSLGVENGERAKFIYNWAQDNFTTPQEKNAYIADLRKKKIISDQVLKQLKQLAAQAKGQAE